MFYLLWAHLELKLLIYVHFFPKAISRKILGQILRENLPLDTNKLAEWLFLNPPKLISRTRGCLLDRYGGIKSLLV